MSYNEDNAGWGWLYNSTKWHYFIKGRSLCGRWLTLGKMELEKGKDDYPSNCKACKEKLGVLKRQVEKTLEDVNKYEEFRRRTEGR